MRFAYPFMLALVALVPVAALWWSFLRARREKALARLTLDVPKAGGRTLQSVCFTLGLLLSLFAASRPQWGRSQESRVTRSRNVVIAIDVSRSMLAEDVRPNRLERTKADVADLIDSLKGDRCALVAFRRTGVTLCPLTTDRGFLRSTLESLTPDSAPRGETDIGSAIRESLQVIANVDGIGDGAKADHSAIIVISDGGDLRGGALDAAEMAKKRGVPVFTVGIGDPKTGAPVPAEGGGVTRHGGKTVMVKLESDALKQIAKASGGRYVELATAGTVDTTLGSIYSRFLRQVAAKEQNEDESRLGERYQLFLIPGLALLIAGASLSRGRFRASERGNRGR